MNAVASIEDVADRYPFQRPLAENVGAVELLASAVRSQALYDKLAAKDATVLLGSLHTAQDDIASAIQLIEKRTGSKAA